MKGFREAVRVLLVIPAAAQPPGEDQEGGFLQGDDRMTFALTVFALHEHNKRGEARWEHEEPFGEITVRAEAPAPPLRVAAAARHDAVSRTVPS